MKYFQFKMTMREKLIGAFMAYSILSVIMTAACFLVFQRLEHSDEVSILLENYLLTSIEVVKKSDDFLIYETHNIKFYQTGQSEYINEERRFELHADSLSDKIEKQSAVHDFEIDDELMQFKKSLHLFEETFIKMIDVTLKKGYGNYGAEGGMRKSIHQLEVAAHVDKVLLLSLRRYEKDYVMQNEDFYIDSVARYSEMVAEGIRKNPKIDDPQKNAYLSMLNDYNDNFKLFIHYRREIGFLQKSGLSLQLKEYSENIESLIDVILTKAQNRKEELSFKIRVFYVGIIIFSIVIILFLTVLFQVELDHHMKVLERRQHLHAPQKPEKPEVAPENH